MEKIVQGESSGQNTAKGNGSRRIEVITDPDQIRKQFLELVSHAQKEILILFPTQAAFRREEIIGVNDEIEVAALHRGVNVRLLTPVDNDVREKITAHNWAIDSQGRQKNSSQLSSPEIREVDSPSTEVQITFVIFDRSKSFIIEVKDDSKLEFRDAIGLATYSDSKPTVSSYVVFFEKLWHESVLRKSESTARQQLTESLRREEKSSDQAKLLQDIMAHDIVNYNQIIKLQAEMLEEGGSHEGPEYQDALRSIRAAVDGSTALLENARKLGRVLSSQNRELFPRNIKNAIENSITLVVRANPGRKVVHNAKYDSIDSNESLLTLADELLDDIFANLYSNSVKYTDGNLVEIETSVNKTDSFWKISIGDKGRGIPDDRKANLFNRYSTNSKGSGLGLSIVHALITRYSGHIHVEDRVKGDHSKGAVFHLKLPMAPRI